VSGRSGSFCGGAILFSSAATERFEEWLPPHLNVNTHAN
jgi:hypothetical protein